MAVRVQQPQIANAIILVMVVPRMQFEVLLALDHLPPDRAAPMLSGQDVGTTP
jgi:hypothetical protein